MGTAILIIYSTFAAIYYSKVNPLVSDYDYTDYLGGGRSLSGGDLDFVDDTNGNDDDDDSDAATATHQRRWYDWLPRAGHSLKFVLDAIDKLPMNDADSGEVNAYATANGDDADAVTQTDTVTNAHAIL